MATRRGVAPHPLSAALERAFQQLSDKDHPSKSLLLSIVEGEGEIMLHRSHPVNLHNKALSKLVSDWLRTMLCRPETRVGVVMAIEVLMNVEFSDPATLAILYANIFRVMFREEHNHATLRRASDAFGAFLSNQMAFVADTVDASLTAALENFQTGEFLCTRRFAAALVVEQVATHYPGALVGHLDTLFSGAWDALRDEDIETRHAVAATFDKVVRLALESKNDSSQDWINNSLKIILQLLSVRNGDTLHGAVLALQGVLDVVSDRRCAWLDTQRVFETWTAMINLLQRSHARFDVRQAVANTFPVMAKYDPSAFVAKCVPDIVAVAATVFRNPSTLLEDRAIMFLLLGNLSLVLKDKVGLFIHRIIPHIENNLSPKPGRSRCNEAATCLAMLAKADAASVGSYVLPLMDALFSGSATPDFAQNVACLCEVFPQINSFCLDRMLKTLGKALGGVRLRDLDDTPTDTALLLTSLEALRYLPFKGYPVLPFLDEFVVVRLRDPSLPVRRVAAQICSTLIFSSCVGSESPCTPDGAGSFMHKGRTHLRYLRTVQSELLGVAVADPDADFRLEVLNFFEPTFDASLASHEAIRILLPALNDRFANRQVALKILGRLARRNPAAVLPTLRRLILTCSSEIELMANARKQDQAVATLGTLVEAAPMVAAPYTSALLSNVVTLLQDERVPSAVQRQLLSTAGKLVRRTTTAELALVYRLRPTVVNHIIQRTSDHKCQEAIKALGAVIRATQDVDVYMMYPNLLNSLTSMLHGALKESWAVRHDVLELMGIIGATDATRVKGLERIQKESASEETTSHVGRHCTEGDIAQFCVTKIHSTVLEVYSMDDDSCEAAAAALTTIFTSTKELPMTVIVPSMLRVVPALLKQIDLRAKLRAKLFRELTTMVSVIKHYVRALLDDLFKAIFNHVNDPDPVVVVQVVTLVAELRMSLSEELRSYLGLLVPLLVEAVANDSDGKEVTTKILLCFETLGVILDQEQHIVLPCVLDTIANDTLPTDTRLKGLATLHSLAKQLPGICDFVGRCVHTLCRVFEEPRGTPTISALHQEALDTLLTLLQCLGMDMSRKFLPMVKPSVVLRFANSPEQLNKFSALERGGWSDRRWGMDQPTRRSLRAHTAEASAESDGRTRTDRSFAAFKAVVAAVDRVGEDEWVTWLRNVIVELVRSAPSASLRACLQLAQRNELFAREVFFPSFAICFREMEADSRHEVVQKLTTVLKHSKLPLEVLQALLNLGEYMERNSDVSPPPPPPTRRSSSIIPQQHGSGLFDVRLLMDLCERCNLHAKALHYAESCFIELSVDFDGKKQGSSHSASDPRREEVLRVCDKLIFLSHHLGIRENATGVVAWMKQHFSAHSSAINNPKMYARLRLWKESYQAHRGRHDTTVASGGAPSIKNFEGMMVAQDELGDFNEVISLWKSAKKLFPRRDLHSLSELGARASWLLQMFPDLADAAAHMNQPHQQAVATFYGAVCALQARNVTEARRLIALTRKLEDTRVSALIAESYERAYSSIVSQQQLSELDEIATFLESYPIGTTSVTTMPSRGHTSTAISIVGSSHNPHAAQQQQQLQSLVRLWEKRMEAMAQVSIELQGTLANHSLIVRPIDELKMWLRFAHICATTGRRESTERVFSNLLNGKSLSQAVRSESPPHIDLLAAVADHMNSCGQFDDAKACLHEVIRTYDMASRRSRQAMGRCLALEASWYSAKRQHITALELLQRATAVDPESSEVWHQWAMTNQHLAATKARNVAGPSVYVVAALDGFVKSIGASPEPNIQHVLRLLSLWFTYGGDPEVDDMIDHRIDKIAVNAWLGVIPQIIARLHTPEPSIALRVRLLLTRVAKDHAQALMFPLSVNIHAKDTGGDVAGRRQAAQEILEAVASTGDEGAKLVSQARLISLELIRTAVLWPEMWYAEIEAAASAYQVNRNAETLWQAFEPLLLKLSSPSTGSEEMFANEFSKQLLDIATLLDGYLKSNNESEMKQATDLLGNVHAKLRRQLQSISSLVLHFVSPALVAIGQQPLSIVVPGMYQPGNLQGSPRISSFVPFLKVMNSKQRPRRVTIIGDDGVHYKFLLKGHEDLRQDERVMQLLGLVNSALESHRTTSKQDLEAQRFSVTPLSDNVGLIGWVDHCETLHGLIKAQRSLNNVPLAREVNLVATVSDGENLCAVQKLEAFEYALVNSDGLDIAKAMWMRSFDAETWLARRTTYVRTLASMSMVGYVLGLGDRHPMNMMIHAYSGKVVHIDFGDCFEVAMLRSLHPETVPFRLTRMLVKAMDVCGVKGSFFHWCKAVMDVLRLEKDSLMAMLEAFVYDPLISWRLQLTDSMQPAAVEPATFLQAEDHTNDVDLQNTIRSCRQRTLATRPTDAQNARAHQIVSRINDRLNGSEENYLRLQWPLSLTGKVQSAVSTQDQVARVIAQATANENLSQLYPGWCPLW